MDSLRMGKRGTVVIPSALRRRYGFEEGTLIVAEARPEGILLSPAITLPLEVYSRERKAEFLLNNAVTPEDYSWARSEVRKLGLDPDAVPHDKPAGR
jgi:bifunctional DNA-binding transcriptional regulator/antitoxin component of YhaV-PrlF toxin-antitoxin module